MQEYLKFHNLIMNIILRRGYLYYFYFYFIFIIFIVHAMTYCFLKFEAKMNGHTRETVAKMPLSSFSLFSNKICPAVQILFI